MTHTTQNRSRLKRDILALTLGCAVLLNPHTAQRLHGQGTEIALTQTITSEAAYANAICLSAKKIDVRLRFAVADALKDPKATLKNFSIQYQPFDSLSILAGSISVAGLPAIAKTPTFTVSSPFYEPQEISQHTILSQGNSTKSGMVGIEFYANKFQAVAYTSRFEGSTDPSWVVFSQLFGSPNTTKISVSYASFTGLHRALNSESLKWFSNRQAFPETNILTQGLECQIVAGTIGANLEGFVNFSQFKKSTGLLRGEAYFEKGPILISGGFFSSSRDFIALTGKQPSLLEQAFIAPYIALSPAFLPGIMVSLGSTVCAYSRESDVFNAKDEKQTSESVGIKINTTDCAFRLEVLSKEDYLTITTSFEQDHFAEKPVNIRCMGKLKYEDQEPTSSSPKSASVTSIISYELTHSLLITTGYGVNWQRTASSLAHEGSMALRSKFRSRSLDWVFSIEVGISNAEKPLEASIGITTKFQ